jgi:hypothetical protein
MKPARLPIGNASAWSEGASDISTASRDCSRLEADVLATPDWLKIRKGFEAHSIYSIDMSPRRDAMGLHRCRLPRARVRARYKRE